MAKKPRKPPKREFIIPPKRPMIEVARIEVVHRFPIEHRADDFADDGGTPAWRERQRTHVPQLPPRPSVAPPKPADTLPPRRWTFDRMLVLIIVSCLGIFALMAVCFGAVFVGLVIWAFLKN